MEENVRHDGASPSTAHIDIGLAVEADLGVPKSTRVEIMIGDHAAASDLLSSLRMSVATHGEMVHAGQSSNSDDIIDLSWKSPVSLRNERSTIKKLQGAVLNAVARYPTTLEEDLDLLHRTKEQEEKKEQDVSPSCMLVGSNRRNALLVRSDEKRVLAHWLAVCDASLCFLDSIDQGLATWSQYCGLLHATLHRKTSIAVE